MAYLNGRNFAFCYEKREGVAVDSVAKACSVVSPKVFHREKLSETLDASTRHEVRCKQADYIENPQRLKTKVEGSMVSKCANPACSTPFHYLREGKIFRIEVEVTPPTTAQDAVELSNGKKLPFLLERRKAARKVEHFWLCGPCSQYMNLMLDKETGIIVLPKRPVRVAAAAAAS